MSALGWAVGIGVGILAVAAVSGGGSGGGASESQKTTRFSVKRNVITEALALPLSSFNPNDLLNIAVIDTKTGIEMPLVVRVVTVVKDGLATIYEGPLLGPDAIPTGSLFSVFPRDVILRTAALPVPPPGDGLLTRVLTESDVALGPAVFAVGRGFKSVAEMLTANPGVFIDNPSSTIESASPGWYIVDGALLTSRRLSPWTAGTSVKVKVKSFLGSVGAEDAFPSARAFGGTGYGGVGYGAGSVGV